MNGKGEVIQLEKQTNKQTKQKTKQKQNKTKQNRMLLKRGMGNGEWGMG